MSKLYCLCDVVGDGRSRETGYRPAIRDLKVNHDALIPSDPATGRPLANWCLVVVATADRARVLGHAGVDALPDVALSMRWNNVDKAQSDAATAALQRRGVAPPVVAPGDSFGVFVRGVGRRLRADFHEANFDVADTA